MGSEALTLKTMAALTDKPGAPFVMRELTLKPPRPGEILVKIKGVGLCHTDLIAQHGLFPMPFPAVLGHEGAGIVEAIGEEVTDIAIGDHVVISFSSCGSCPNCESDLPAYCHDFAARNYSGRRPGSSTPYKDEIPGQFFGQSSFASHVVCQRGNAVKVDRDLPIDILGPLACGIQTGVGAILNSMDCKPGSSVIIFGGGTVGLSAVMGAKIRDCAKIVLTEPKAVRRKIGLELGADIVIDPSTEDSLIEAIGPHLPTGADYVLETSGKPEMAETGLACLAIRGLLGLVGVPHQADASLSLKLTSMLSGGHRIMGIIEGDADPQSFIPEMLTYYREGRLPFDRLITTFPMREINDAIAAQLTGTCIKPVLIPD